MLLAVAATSVMIGGVTSFAQGFLPEVMASAANSVSGWTLPTALMVWLTARHAAFAAVLGPTSFVGLVLGYTIASDLRGLFYSPVLWGAVALLAGPIVGIAACWLRQTGWRAALGAGVLGGVLIGESCYGLTVVAATTHWFYWVAVALIGLALLAVVLVRRVSRFRDVAAGIATTMCAAAAVPLGFLALGYLIERQSV